MATIPVERGGGPSSYESAYAIFEGGGAKGITHLGALRALEDEGLALVGVAGASAGAIIAALAAVGYRADELYRLPTADAPGGDILRDRLNQNPIDLLGRRGWRTLNRLRRWSLPLTIAIVALGALLLASVLVPVVFHRLGVHGTGATEDVFWGLSVERAVRTGLAILLLGAIAALALLVVPILWRRGLFSTEAMRDTVNRLLRDKLAEHYRELGMPGPVPDPVCFADIDPKSIPLCVPLKIVVTDVRGHAMDLFDAARPGVAVADAVAASAAIPFFFRPPAIRGAPGRNPAPIYADGGLVSNLPAWSFRNEKQALERQQGGPPIPIFAFGLDGAAGTDAAERGRSLLGYIGDVLTTAIFGSQALVQRFVPDLCTVMLPTPLTTLGFDCTRASADGAYREGVEAARALLRRRRLTRQITVRALQTILQEVRDAMATKRGIAVEALPNVRLSLIDPVAGGPGYRVAASANMETDSDDRLELDPGNPIAPACFISRVPLIRAVVDPLAMTKYERALVRRGLDTVIAVPVFARPPVGSPPPPQRVLCLDSDGDLRQDYADATFIDLLEMSATIVSATLIHDGVSELLKETSA
jgi:NTE family protein